MNHAVARPVLPHLPEGKRQYDLDNQASTRTTLGKVIDQVNQTSSVGKTVLQSQPTLTISNSIHHVSGTAAIATITAPKGNTGYVVLIADGAWTTVTTGNISLAVVATIGRAYPFWFDGATWYPTVVA